MVYKFGGYRMSPYCDDCGNWNEILRLGADLLLRCPSCFYRLGEKQMIKHPQGKHYYNMYEWKIGDTEWKSLNDPKDDSLYEPESL